MKFKQSAGPSRDETRRLAALWLVGNAQQGLCASVTVVGLGMALLFGWEKQILPDSTWALLLSMVLMALAGAWWWCWMTPRLYRVPLVLSLIALLLQLGALWQAVLDRRDAMHRVDGAGQYAMSSLLLSVLVFSVPMVAWFVAVAWRDGLDRMRAEEMRTRYLAWCEAAKKGE